MTSPKPRKAAKAPPPPAIVAADHETIVLAGQPYSLPARLPIRINRLAYPLCAKLTLSGLPDQIAARGDFEVTTDQMDDMADLAFACASFADPSLIRDAFDNLAITPLELIDAFMMARFLTGGWVPATPPT